MTRKFGDNKRYDLRPRRSNGSGTDPLSGSFTGGSGKNIVKVTDNSSTDVAEDTQLSTNTETLDGIPNDVMNNINDAIQGLVNEITEDIIDRISQIVVSSIGGTTQSEEDEIDTLTEEEDEDFIVEDDDDDAIDEKSEHRTTPTRRSTRKKQKTSDGIEEDIPAKLIEQVADEVVQTGSITADKTNTAIGAK